MPGARAECPNSSFICGCEEVDMELGRYVDVGAIDGTATERRRAV